MHPERPIRKNITPQQVIELGKLPPQAVDIEVAVLGALMLDKEALENTMEILKPEMFYKEAHQHITAAILSLYSRRDPVDILTVTQEMLKLGTLELAGGAFYVTQLTNRIASAANVQVHARIVLEKFYQRELIRITTETLQGAYEDTTDVLQLITTAESAIASIHQDTAGRSLSFGEVLNKSEEELMQREQARLKGGIAGVPTGLTHLDKLTGGWQKGNFIIVAARPSRGKSALAIHLAKAAASKGVPVGIFMLDMKDVAVTDRALLGASGIDYFSYRNGTMNTYQWEDFRKAKAKLSELQILIDDTPGLSIMQLRARAKRMKKKYGIGLIIFDYLQQATTGIDRKSTITNREQEVSYLSRSMKAIAKEEDVPFIALCQLSRATEARSGKRPQLSDLRESGSLEQDATMVIFPYNPFKDGITEDEGGNSTEGRIELIIAKNQNGPVDSVFVGCNSSMTQFYDLSNNLETSNAL